MKWNYKTIVFLLTIVLMTNHFSVRVSASTIYSFGSTGKTVSELQEKLSQWGYYKGVIDGKYGYQTYEAVRYFQKQTA